jgi:thioesterase domain-containing protein
MSTAEFLAVLRRRDVHLRSEDGELRCSAPAGAVTPELREELQRRKAELLEHLMRAQARAVVPLQPRGTRTPVFGVPGHNGDVFCYRALARNLGDEQPFYGLQPPGVDGQGDPLERVEELAAYFVEQIRACEPLGPYVIAGYCAGGTTAFEVAQQLIRGGATVHLLALFGCPYPAYFRLPTQFGLRLAAKAEHSATLVREVASLSWQELREYLAEKMRAREARRDNAEAAARDPVLAQRAKVEQATLVAVRRYTPQHYPGRLGLFLPGSRWQNSGVGAQRWRSVASRTLERFGPQQSDGYDMLREPHAAAFAELFRDAAARLAGPEVRGVDPAAGERELAPKGIAVRRLG